MVDNTGGSPDTNSLALAWDAARISVYAAFGAFDAKHGMIDPLPAIGCAYRPMRYWEDLDIGETRRYGAYRLTAAEIADFSARFAAPGVAGAPADAASATLLCGVAMRLLVDHALVDMASLGSPGVDRIDWPAPARAGDVLALVTETLESRVLASRPEMGLIKQRVEMTNQRGDVVARLWTNALIARRAHDA